MNTITIETLIFHTDKMVEKALEIEYLKRQLAEVTSKLFSMQTQIGTAKQDADRQLVRANQGECTIISLSDEIISLNNTIIDLITFGTDDLSMTKNTRKRKVKK